MIGVKPPSHYRACLRELSSRQLNMRVVGTIVKSRAIRHGMMKGGVKGAPRSNLPR
jgi:hypothetical protein